MDEPSFSFILTTCQRGAELALRREVMRRYPNLHPAYGRSGFVTFKAANTLLTPHFELESVFARAWAFSLGKLAGQTPEARIDEAWEKTASLPIRWIHVWSPDPLPAGDYDFEPRITPEALSVRSAFLARCPFPERLSPQIEDPNAPAQPGDWVLDCVLVREEEWFLGVHVAWSAPSCYPGGLLPWELPPEAISRAYLKMKEALLWSGFPLRPGGRWLEIGCAPGGSSQALLEAGQMVVGVDPAEVDPRIAQHPHFTHIRKRISRVPRRLFRKIRWLSADMNVAPNYTLEVVESIVLNQHVSIRGMILMLKLLEWDEAERIELYLERVRSWGFNRVRARQLQFNRQEICVAAMQKPFRPKPLPARYRRRARTRPAHPRLKRQAESGSAPIVEGPAASAEPTVARGATPN